MSTASITEKAGGRASQARPMRLPVDGKTAGIKVGQNKLILVLVAVLILVGAVVWLFFLRGGGEEEADPAPEPGIVVRMDPISVNLTDGHYLKVGLALQATLETAEEPDGSHAQALAVAKLSERTVEGLADSAAREAIRAELVAEVTESHEGELMDVWFYEFVTQ